MNVPEYEAKNADNLFLLLFHLPSVFRPADAGSFNICHKHAFIWHTSQLLYITKSTNDLLDLTWYFNSPYFKSELGFNEFATKTDYNDNGINVTTLVIHQVAPRKSSLWFNSCHLLNR